MRLPEYYYARVQIVNGQESGDSCVGGGNWGLICVRSQVWVVLKELRATFEFTGISISVRIFFSVFTNQGINYNTKCLNYVVLTGHFSIFIRKLGLLVTYNDLSLNCNSIRQLLVLRYRNWDRKETKHWPRIYMMHKHKAPTENIESWAPLNFRILMSPPKSIIPTDHVSSVFTHQSTLLIIQTVINLFGKHRIFDQCEWFPESIKLYLLKQCPFDYDSWRKTQQRSIITALQSQAHNMSHWFIHPPTTISTKYAAEYSENNDKIRLRLVSKKYRQN